MLAMTDTLRAKYLDAKAMTLQASGNYQKFADTIETDMIHIWQQEIQLAERNRLKDIKAMDVYSARIPSTSGPSSNAPAGPMPGLGLECEPAPQYQWMEFVLFVEETQSVLFIYS